MKGFCTICGAGGGGPRLSVGGLSPNSVRNSVDQTGDEANETLFKTKESMR